jgi:hypothetical protein
MKNTTTANNTELNSGQRIILQVAMMKQIRDSYSLRNTKLGGRQFFREDARNAVSVLRAVRNSDKIELSRI